MKSIIKSLLNKRQDNNVYDKWSYIKIKERNMHLWIDNIFTLKM